MSEINEQGADLGPPEPTPNRLDYFAKAPPNPNPNARPDAKGSTESKLNPMHPGDQSLKSAAARIQKLENETARQRIQLSKQLGQIGSFAAIDKTRTADLNAARGRIEELHKQVEQGRETTQIGAIVGRSLDESRVAYDVANEVHRLLPGSRVSVAMVNGKVAKVKAVSNQQVLNRRSADVVTMERLASLAAASNTPVWRSDDDHQYSPELRSALDAYDEACNTYSLAILPLHAPMEPSEDPGDLGAVIRDGEESEGDLVAMLVIEGMRSSISCEEIDNCLKDIRAPIATAIANAKSHSGLLFMPVWRAASDFFNLFRGHHRRKAYAAAIVAAVIGFALVLVPGDLRLRCNGSLQPVARSRVFAEVEGVVNQLLVEAGQNVTKGQLLLTLENPALRAEIADVEGRLRETREKLVTSKLQRVTGRFANAEERRQAVLETAGLQASVDVLDREYQLLIERESQLDVRSPSAGQIVTWDLARRLGNRPVQPGQRLMEIADVGGNWELELKLPDRRASYLRDRFAGGSAANGDAPTVTYVVASQPNSAYEATVTAVAKSSVVDETEGNVVLVSALVESLPNNDQAMRPGTDVISHIHAGRASLGYCKLYECFAWMRRLWFTHV